MRALHDSSHAQYHRRSKGKEKAGMWYRVLERLASGFGVWFGLHVSTYTLEKHVGDELGQANDRKA